ncbi:hypothetical protein [Marinactinospora rubrisoli]|uniref:Uncharacterized protein n=1 Tax=Marinactinospora rubrisoli TaxID=2715399 RepID=A0ABW2KJC5_9ACTN
MSYQDSGDLGPRPCDAGGQPGRLGERGGGVGLLAQRSGVKTVVLTRNPLNDANIATARATIASYFSGPVAFADDLDNY